MRLRLDTLSYGNGLRDLPPAHKLLFAAVLLLIVSAGHHLVQFLVFCWVSHCIIRYAKISLRTYVALLSVSLAFFLAGAPALLLEFARTEQLPEGAWLLFAWKEWGLYATRGSLELAGKLFLRTLSSVSCLFFILLTIPFAELLQVLRRLGLPAVLTELLLLVYRFIFVVLNTASQLWIAQKSRGGHSGFRNTIRDMGILVGQLFVRTMQRYRQMHDGMAARGFTEDFQVVSTRTYVRSRRFEREAVVGCALLAVLEWWTGG